MTTNIKTLGAFTDPASVSYPPYFNASHDVGLDVVVLTIRGEAGTARIEQDGVEKMITVVGETVQSVLTPDEFCRMLGEIISNCDDDMKDRVIRYATESE